MSFGIDRGKDLDIAPGVVAISPEEFPPLPDAVADNPDAGRLDVRSWFPDPSLPFELEIGSGKGTFLVQQAALQPDVNFLGIEWAKEFFTYAADRIRRHRMTNVRMLHTNATEFMHWRVPDGCCRVVHLYFSDPWPKKRHHKRRVVQDRFLKDVHRILEPDGELRIVTDHMDYWAWMEEHFDRWCAPDHTPRFERLPFERPESAGDGEVVGTNFERKYRREGRPFNAAILRRQPVEERDAEQESSRPGDQANQE